MKKILNTSKAKQAFTAIISFALLLSLCAGIAIQAHAATQYIGKEKAKSIALTHAGLSESDIRKMDIDFDRSRSGAVYEVDFRYGKTKYEYELDAVSGEIIWSSNNGNLGSADETQYIGTDQAKSIALTHAGASADTVRRFAIKLDRDDGRTVYEIEFLQDRMEYEYEIDAVSGEIIHWEAERD